MLVALLMTITLASYETSPSDPVATPSQSASTKSGEPPRIQINPQGTFVDHALWAYKTPDGKIRNGDGVAGTNELISLPPPSPGPGEQVADVTLVRHHFDTLGYPLHISLAEKLFAGDSKVSIFVGDQYEVWQFTPGTNVAQEAFISGTGPGGRAPSAAQGPFPADGPIPDQYAKAFEFAKGVLRNITNMPDSQKDLKNYVVLFTETPDVIWVEFGPVFASSEAPHLGCQTQLGRDLVIGYDKVQQSKTASNGPATVGEFLQCF